MILITGGAWQGKLSFAASLMPEKIQLSDRPLHEACKVAEGIRDHYEAAFHSEIIHGLHEYIRRLLKEGKSVDDFLSQLMVQNKDAIVITNELGCGIVPMDPEERKWRETSGRAAVYLAKSSEAVYRVMCGIGVRIK